jgi:hypothetical protein
MIPAGAERTALLDQPEEAPMQSLPTERPPLSDRSGVTDAVRAQILATEHWSLLATRGMTWNEMFSRAAMFLTVLSAAVVALALVAQATDFGGGFRAFAFLVLPVVLLLGWATYVRLTNASAEDLWLVVGMNRLRHAYLELAPELEPYFVTAHHDDAAGVVRTLSFVDYDGRVDPSSVLASTPLLIGVITSVVAGVLAGLAVEALGGAPAAYVAAGVVIGLACAAAIFAAHVRAVLRLTRAYRTRFPGGGTGDA